MMKSYANEMNNQIVINHGNVMMSDNENFGNNMMHNPVINSNNMNLNRQNNCNNQNNSITKDYYDQLSSKTGKGITLENIRDHQSKIRQRNPIMMSRTSSNRPFLSGNDAIQNSQLSPNIKLLMYRLFVQDNELDKSCIEEPSLRLLEEITEEEQQEAINEFVDRYKKAKHKIKKSKPGYFRGVCQKYWKQNREIKKRELLKRASQNSHYKYSSGLSPLVAETIESLFTTASGLETSIIDESVEKRLTQLNDQQAIEALHEFCSAVMYRQERIRNMNAYLMNIIKRHVMKEGNRGQQLITKPNITDKNNMNAKENDYNTNTGINTNTRFQIQSITNNINIQAPPGQLVLPHSMHQQPHQYRAPTTLPQNPNNLSYSYNSNNAGRAGQSIDINNPNYQMCAPQQQQSHFYQHPHLLVPHQQHQRHNAEHVPEYIPTFCPAQLPQINNEPASYSSVTNNNLIPNNNTNRSNDNGNNASFLTLPYCSFNYVPSIPNIPTMNENNASHNTALYSAAPPQTTQQLLQAQPLMHAQSSPSLHSRQQQQIIPQQLFTDNVSNFLNDTLLSTVPSVSLTLSMPGMGRTPSFSISNIALSPLAADMLPGTTVAAKECQNSQELQHSANKAHGTKNNLLQSNQTDANNTVKNIQENIFNSDGKQITNNDNSYHNDRSEFKNLNQKFNSMNTHTFENELHFEPKPVRMRKPLNYYYTPQLQTIHSSGFENPTFDNEDENSLHNQASSFIKSSNSNDHNINCSNDRILHKSNDKDNSNANGNENNKFCNRKFGSSLNKEQGEEINKRLEKLGPFEDSLVFVYDENENNDDDGNEIYDNDSNDIENDAKKIATVNKRNKDNDSEKITEKKEHLKINEHEELMGHQYIGDISTTQNYLQQHSKSEPNLLSLKKNVIKQHNKNINETENDNHLLTKSTSSNQLAISNKIPVLQDKYQTFPLYPKKLYNKSNNDSDLINNESHHTTSSLSSTSQFSKPKMTNSRSIPLRLNEYQRENNDDNQTSSHVPKLQQSYSDSYYQNTQNFDITNHPKNSQQHYQTRSQCLINNDDKVINHSQLLSFKEQHTHDCFDEHDNNLPSISLQTNETTKLERQNHNITDIDMNNVISNSNQYSGLTSVNANVNGTITSNDVQHCSDINGNVYDNQDRQIISQFIQQKNAINNNNNNNDTINHLNETMNQNDNQLNVNFSFPVSMIPNSNCQQHQFQQMFSFGTQFNNSQSNILLENNNSIPQDQLFISIGNNNNNTIHNNNINSLGPLSNVASPIITPTNQNLRPMTPSSSSLGLAQTPQLTNNSNWSFVNINGCIAPVQKILNNFNTSNNNYNNHNYNESQNLYFNNNNNNNINNNNIIPSSNYVPFVHQNQHLPQFNNNINIPMFNAMSQTTMPTTNMQPSLTKMNNVHQIHPCFHNYNANIGSTTATTSATTTQR